MKEKDAQKQRKIEMPTGQDSDVKETNNEQVMYSPVTNLSYFGFEAEKDAAYMRQLDEIFIESKIKW